MAYESGLLREWGKEFADDAPDEGEQETDSSTLNSEVAGWDPVKIALGYLDLTPYCDLPSQIAGTFLQAGFWFYKALQNLGDGTGNDDWAEDFIN